MTFKNGAKLITLPILCAGPGVSKMKTFLGSAVLVGLLKEMASSDVNLVNAPLMAQEMGVTVTVDDHPDICPSIAAAGPEAVEVKVTRGLNTHTLLGERRSAFPTNLALILEANTFKTSMM